MKTLSMFPNIILLLLHGMLVACDREVPVDTSNPSELTLEVTLAKDGSGVADIQALATHAIEYQLFVNGGSDPVATNSSGTFRYTFLRSGIYIVEVRAFGSSGKFVKETREVLVSMEDAVPLDKGYSTSLVQKGYELQWNDEFEGNSVNLSNWKFEIGNGCPNNCGWGNNEKEYYRKENTTVAEGVLKIEARAESFQGFPYTSSRLISERLQSFRYGRVDIRALLPKGQGLWPALWMLGSNIGSVGWPSCGEIDIMEMIGGQGRDNTVHGTIHWDNNGEHAKVGGSSSLPVGTFADEYHVFTILWDETSIKWLVNDRAYYSVSIEGESMGEFHQPFFFILNVAVGGNWPGSPDNSTIFPQSMKVDYVRVFQKQN
jgi:beta-glucanase (GH16 family)